MVKAPLKLVQIAVAHWGTSYSVLGLSDAGNVYRLQKAGWVALPMHIHKQNPSEASVSDHSGPRTDEQW